MPNSTATFPGARFYSCDLHVHTPASHDYDNKALTAAQMVAAALKTNLDVIAVTDHNSAEWVDHVRAAAKKTRLIVLPGVEVSTPHCHILAIFDGSTTKSHIDDFLTTVGIKTADRGKKEVNSIALDEVLDKIREFDGVAVAAHANSSNGILQQGTGQYRIKLCNDPRVSALEFTKQDDVNRFSRGAVAQYKPKACVQGSDSHSPERIGERRTYLKMDVPSIWGLRQSFEDHEIRIRHEWTFRAAEHPSVLSLSATQGFFAGVPFTFHPSLNCLVGGRGTGKSTALELMRFAFGDESSIADIAADSRSKLEALLGEGGIVEVIYLDSDGVVKIIRREFALSDDVEPIIKTQDGGDAAILTPPVFFSQGELTQIARERVAQLDLIDRYVDVAQDRAEEKRLLRDLRANGAQLVRLKTLARTVDSDVSDLNNGLVATQTKYKTLEKTLKDPVLIEYPRWESEERHILSAVAAIDAIETEMVEFFDSLNIKDRVEEAAGDLPNAKSLSAIQTVFSRATAVFAASKKQLLQQFKQRRQEIERIKADWRPKFEAKRAAYDAALAKAGTDDVRKANGTLRQLKKRLDDLEQKAKGQSATVKQAAIVEKQRDELVKALVKCRRSRRSKRVAKATAWNAQFGGRIQVAIAQYPDLEAYIESLRNLTKGAMLRDTDLAQIAESCSPTRVRELIETGDHDALSTGAGIKADNARKCVEVASTKPTSELFELECVSLPDVPEIRYEARPGSVRSLTQLSVGQKATVIISLALVEGDSPLIIDQPEEPLDTLAITNPVVDTLRSQKELRQFIFTTHNANVAVGADAELNIVLDASADQGKIGSAGGIDHPDTNELLVLHLEGGPEAIRRRVGKYRPAKKK